MITRVLSVLLLLVSAGAWANEPAAMPHTQDTPSHIIHHVSDSLDYEFEIPWPGVEHNPTIHLGKIFEPLVFEKTPGACHKDVPAAYSAAPGLGAWIENGCYDMRPTKSILMMWIAAALLLFLVFRYSHRDHTKHVPTGVGANIVEVLVLFVRDEIAVKNIGKEEAPRYTPYLATIFFFILTMNWLGLIPNFGSATGNLAVTAALASCTFVLTQIASIRSAGIGGYLKHLTGGTPMWLWPIMIPVEILGLFTKPFALTVRLFANMLAGHMVLFFLLGLIFMLHPALAVISVPMATAIYFLEIFVGLVQAYIFTLLSALFIGMGVAMGHHGHEAHAEEGAHH
jgi:F-type H+-transporting ATPase subunit a